MSPDTFAELKFARDKNNQLVFPATSSVEQIAAGLGVEDIVIVDNVKIGKNKEADTKLFEDGIIVSLASKRYNLSMASGFDNFQDFDIKYNNDQFLTEVLVGGSIAARRMAKVVTVKATPSEA